MPCLVLQAFFTLAKASWTEIDLLALLHSTFYAYGMSDIHMACLFVSSRRAKVRLYDVTYRNHTYT